MRALAQQYVNLWRTVCPDPTAICTYVCPSTFVEHVKLAVRTPNTANRGGRGITVTERVLTARGRRLRRDIGRRRIIAVRIQCRYRFSYTPDIFADIHLTMRFPILRGFYPITKAARENALS